MDAFTILQNLHDRGLDVRLADDGRLLVMPGKALTDADREAIRAHLPALKRLVSCNFTQHPDGWSQDPDMLNRVALVRRGHLIDSCLFRTAGGAVSFLHRVSIGEPPGLAFIAACAAEDCAVTHPFHYGCCTLRAHARAKRLAGA